MSEHISLLSSFDDPLLKQEWNGLLKKQENRFIFISFEWQKAWWKAFGRGKLLIVVARKKGVPVCIAPLFADSGMLFFIGSGGSDYLDFIGIGANDLLIKMISFAIDHTENFLGCRFYLIPEHSQTVKLLKDLDAEKFRVFEEGELCAPYLDMSNADHFAKMPQKKSLLRHEAWLRNNGDLLVKHFTDAEQVLPLLPHFFDQHIARWSVTDHPSIFHDEKQRIFYSELCKELAGAGWLRFTVIRWNGKAIAYHFGFNYEDSFFWYKPSFDISMAKYSPGEVLLRQLLLRANEEKAHTFDFGLGEEKFKERFATGKQKLMTIGLYPHE